MVSKFDGEHFVGFVDLSGFKMILNNSVEKAKNALISFQESFYDALRTNHTVEGIFVSDTAILFVRDEDSKTDQLVSLLEVIKSINRSMIKADFLLISSISFGEFHFEEIKQFTSRVITFSLYGKAYLNAYKDNEITEPKLEPGLCRIVKEGLPEEVFQHLMIESNKKDSYEKISVVEENNHFYYYWMIESGTVSEFIKEYKRVHELPYLAYRRAIKKVLLI